MRGVADGTVVSPSAAPGDPGLCGPCVGAQNLMAETRPPPPLPLFEWENAELIGVLAHAPFTTHGSLRAVCRRLRRLLSSPEFRRERLKENGHAERGLIVAGGTRGGTVVANCWQLVGRRWRPIAPLSVPRFAACSAVFEGEMYVLGGADGQPLATVEAFNPQTRAWRSLPPMSTPRSGGSAAPRGISVVGLEGDGKPYPSADTGVRLFNQRPSSAVVARREKVTSPTP